MSILIRSKFSEPLRLKLKSDPFTCTVRDQSIVDMCNINKLYLNYCSCGDFYPGMFAGSSQTRQPSWGSVPSGDNLLAASLETQLRAKEAFAQLSPDIRNRFNNNPRIYYDFVTDPSNRDECIKLGIINPPKPDPEPIKVKVISDDPASD